MARTPTYEDARSALTLRLPKELHQGLREHKLYTGTPTTDLVVSLVAEFLAGRGREEIIAGMSRRAGEQYGPVLDKLRDM